VSEGPRAPLNTWALRARQVIAGGTSTGSKRPDALYGSALASDLPTHARRSWGCRLETAEGLTLIDLSMALGAVALGYADEEISEAVYETVADGTVCGLAPLLEIEVAERLVDVIPCAEQVRFLKSGAEATAAAVRLARTHTGRTRIIASGYFGWHDWSSGAAGVPHEAHDAVQFVPFDDVEALAQAVDVAGTELAAIIIEPLVHHVASAEWLAAARAHCDRVGAVLVFDEIKTAFRIRTGGVQALRGITPDLTTLGKAMANGFPLAAVVGRRSVMSAASRTWISSTLAAETTALVAARVVLDRHARRDVCAELAIIGGHLQATVHDALTLHPIGVRAEGEAAMWRLVAEHEPVLDALVAECARRGVLLKRGAYQFASLAHDEPAIREVGRVVAVAASRIASGEVPLVGSAEQHGGQT
jgi:glutamate-1-semialdehyde 2,1-aminomutase